MGGDGKVAGDARSDQDLLDLARRGDAGAFEDLYRRHADAAWRAALGILGHPDDAADAFAAVLRALRKNTDVVRILNFRAYLLTAVRHAAIDRRRGREVAVDTGALADDETLAGPESPPDQVIDLTDGAFARQAFGDLPERWRRVLWLTEVEGLRPVDAAPRLGMNANAVAQLAFRARAGLRERFLAAHLRAPADTACGDAVDLLPAYVTARLGPSELAAVRRHLDACTACAGREEELEAVGSTRRFAALAPALLLGGALRRAASLLGGVETAASNLATPTAAKLAAAAVATAVTATGGLATVALRAADPPPPREAAASVSAPGTARTARTATAGDPATTTSAPTVPSTSSSSTATSTSTATTAPGAHGTPPPHAAAAARSDTGGHGQSQTGPSGGAPAAHGSSGSTPPGVAHLDDDDGDLPRPCRDDRPEHPVHPFFRPPPCEDLDTE